MSKQQPTSRAFIFQTVMLLILSLLFLGGCDNSEPTESAPKNAGQKSEEQPATAESVKNQTPPTPPIVESFEKEPQLSLFPRAGDYRPERESERYPYWNTFIEHIIKTSGPIKNETEDNKLSWALRGIKTIDSVGFFSPLAVQPATRYQISFRIKTELVDGASAGIGILEFSEFLWIGDQFTKAQMEKYSIGSKEGIRLTGTRDWEEQTFTLTTGAQTNMIHLIFFREGEHDRKPVLLDDISVTPL